MTTIAAGNRLVTVFGGSGFIGRHVVRALARRGWRIRVAVRRPNLANHLQPLGSVGQIHAVQANVRDRESVARALAGADAVINLVGILHESGRPRLDAVHAAGPGLIAEAAHAEGIGRFVHISAIGADPESDSLYQRTKAAGEAAVRAHVPEAVILRPSIVFGPEDAFFNRFAAMARLSPALPLIGGGHTRFQPVFVGDVADAVAMAVDGEAMPGTTYELGGPEVRTFRELMEIMLREIGRNRLLVSIPFPVARMQARVLQLCPRPLLTVDQVRQLAHDNVVSREAEEDGRGFRGLGIQPRTMAVVLPTYLGRYRREGQFSRRERNGSTSRHA